MGIVYKATNRQNGNRYIGATKYSLRRRQGGHFSQARRGPVNGMPFISAMRKYGQNNFVWEILFETDDIEQLMRAEISFISEQKPEYNVASGGRGIRGIKRSEKWKADMSQRFKGRTLSPEGVAKMVAMTRAGLHNKSILCLEDNRLFVSVKSAAKAYGLGAGSLGSAATGKWTTSGGLHFVFSSSKIAAAERSRMIAEAEALKTKRILIGQRARTPASRLEVGRRAAPKGIFPSLSPIPAPDYREGTVEKWGPVVGYEGFYEISDHGHVRSVDRLVGHYASKTGMMRRHGRPMAPRPMADGRLFVNLYNGTGKVWAASVGILVAEAFVRPRLSGEEVLRRDGNPLNDKASNLFWGTAADRSANREKHGRTSRKINQNQISEILAVRGQEFQGDTAKRMGVAKSLICAIQNGRLRVSLSEG